jgi:hypothetical protein
LPLPELKHPVIDASPFGPLMPRQPVYEDDMLRRFWQLVREQSPLLAFDGAEAEALAKYPLKPEKSGGMRGVLDRFLGKSK